MTGDVLSTYYQRRKAGQRKWIDRLTQAMEEISGSEEYKSNGNGGEMLLSRVPFFDVELVGIPALDYVGRSYFVNDPAFSHLMAPLEEEEDSKFVICGGKGGVGKTTTSSTLAISMANQGHDVALISTDPAHSLGDAINMDLAGGSLIQCLLPPTSQGSLSVMEIDPSAALGEFKSVVDDLLSTSESNKSDSNGFDPSALASTLQDLGEVFDTLPAGTDEVVALAKIVSLLKTEKFDRIVLDTAPTGHTLRMLSTPSFLADLIERVLNVSSRINSNPTVKLLLAAGGNSDRIAGVVARARETLLGFQTRMYELEDLFCDGGRTEFLVVTVPTELAVRESVRLLNDLTFDDPDAVINVRNVVVNQVLQEDSNADMEGFRTRVAKAQEECQREMRDVCREKGVEVTEVHYLDTEPRGVYGLKALEAEMLA